MYPIAGEYRKSMVIGNITIDIDTQLFDLLNTKVSKSGKMSFASIRLNMYTIYSRIYRRIYTTIYQKCE